MLPFKRDYGVRTAPGSEEPYELATTFLSASASIIYAGEFLGALIAAPINDKFGRRAVFASASLAIIAGALVQFFASGIAGVFYLGRVLVGLGVGQFAATCLIYIADVAPTVSELDCCDEGPTLMEVLAGNSWTGTHVLPVHAVDCSIHWSLCQS